jgi:ketosteroid isomerase-like protein
MTKAIEEVQIRTLIDNWATAMRAKDADGRGVTIYRGQR